MDEEQNVAPATPPKEDAVVSGGRVRRTTQKFTIAEQPKDEAADFRPPQGQGTKLRDIESVAEKLSQLNKKDAETVKALYSVLYGRRFQQKNMKLIKEHILDFSGFTETDDKFREQVAAKIGRWMRTFVQHVMDLLEVDRSKKSFDEENKPFDKDSLTQRLIDWLYCPKESGKKVRKSAAKPKAKKEADKPATAKRKSTKASASPAKKQKTGAKTAAKRTTKKKEQVEEEEDLDEDATESENDGDASGDDSSSDFDESKPKKKTAKASGRKSPARKKKNVVEDEEDDEQDEEQHDDENGDDGAKDKDAVEKPAAADYASKSELPADVRAKVSEIVAKGDAEELTLKKVVELVGKSLGRDVSDLKKAIKTFLKAGL